MRSEEGCLNESDCLRQISSIESLQEDDIKSDKVNKYSEITTTAAAAKNHFDTRNNSKNNASSEDTK